MQNSKVSTADEINGRDSGRFTLPNHIIGIGIVFIIPKAIILLQI